MWSTAIWCLPLEWPVSISNPVVYSTISNGFPITISIENQLYWTVPPNLRTDRRVNRYHFLRTIDTFSFNRPISTKMAPRLRYRLSTFKWWNRPMSDRHCYPELESTTRANQDMEVSLRRKWLLTIILSILDKWHQRGLYRMQMICTLQGNLLNKRQITNRMRCTISTFHLILYFSCVTKIHSGCHFLGAYVLRHIVDG